MQGQWLSILEYANYKGKSISTVRRYVKSGKVMKKEENGKYFIFVEDFTGNKIRKEDNSLLEDLQIENKKLRNELAEAMMLIELYEQGRFLNTPSNPPEIPSIL